MNLPIDSPKLDISTFVNLMKKDKKNKNNLINYILLDGIGNSLVKGFVPRRFRIFSSCLIQRHPSTIRM